MFQLTKEVIAKLQAKKEDLERQISARDDIKVEKMADPIDVSTAQANRDTAASNINRAAALYRQVVLALDRAKEGTFGICVTCDEDIPDKRLVAVPWAARCIPCQEEHDNHVGVD